MEPWKILAGVAAGTRKVDRRCADAVATHVVRRPRGCWLLAAVADGAGSAPLGDVGAQVAADAAIAALTQQLGPFGRRQRRWQLADLASQVQGALQAAAAGQGVPVRALATTLTCVAVGDRSGWVAQVGDSACVVRTAQGWQLPIAPTRGEYINATHFATDPQAPWHAARTGHVDAVALLSDGLQPIALEMQAMRPFGPFFEGFAAALAHGDPDHLQPQLLQFLQSPRVAERTDDDVSLLIAVRNTAIRKRNHAAD